MGFQFKKAEKKQVKVKVALMGPSGSGKTYSALALATGLGGPIALIDTESGRSEYYASEFEYDVLRLEPPFTPERYIEAIEAAESAGYKTLIIDSATHEWSGKGGCLDIHGSMPGNSFNNWSKVTPRHDAFLDKMLRCNMHVIATLRGKDQYVQETKEDNGRKSTTIKKIGVGAQMRDGFEYECTITFNIDQESHIATTTKDNTHLFEGKYEVLNKESGEKLREWAEEGLFVEPPATKTDISKVSNLVKDKGIDNPSLKKLMIEVIDKDTFKGVTKKEIDKLIKHIEGIEI